MSVALEGLSSRAIVLRKRIVQLVIDEFKNMDPSGLAGEDSGLTSIWEEVCVQMQVEESTCWDAYIQTIRDFLEACAEELSQDEICTLWLDTGTGLEWMYNTLPSGATEVAGAPYFVSDIVDELEGDFLTAAADYESASIKRYVGRFDGDDPLEDFEDDESEGLEDEEPEDIEEDGLIESDIEESHLYSHIEEPTIRRETYSHAPRYRLANAIDRIASERNIALSHLRAILRDFLEVLHENQVKAWRQEDSLLPQIYYTLGDEAAYHLGGLLAEAADKLEGSDIDTEMTLLDSSMSRFRTTVDRWLIEKEIEIESD